MHMHGNGAGLVAFYQWRPIYFTADRIINDLFSLHALMSAYGVVSDLT